MSSGSFARSAETRLGTTTLVTITDGTIVGAARTSVGVVALISNRHDGQGWDNAPRVIVAKPTSATTVSLPPVEGFPLAQRIEAAGQTVTVTAADYTESRRPRSPGSHATAALPGRCVNSRA